MEGTLNLVEICGHLVDTITINVILSCYGSYHEYKKIKTWIRRMQVDNINKSEPTKGKNVQPKVSSRMLCHEESTLNILKH